MLIFIRHGKTKLNSEEGEKSRGWLPVPVSDEGMEEVEETADNLANLDEDIEKIYCSDLPRSVQTAQEIAHHLNINIEPTFALRDWNVGDYAGKPIKEILGPTHHLIENPSKSAPNGEPYQAFMDRCIPILKKLVEGDEVSVAVSHARVVTLLASMLPSKGKRVKVQVLKDKAPIEPAGIMVVGKDWELIYSTEDENEGDT